MQPALVVQNAQLLLVQLSEEHIAIVNAPLLLCNQLQLNVALDERGVAEAARRSAFILSASAICYMAPALVRCQGSGYHR